MTYRERGAVFVRRCTPQLQLLCLLMVGGLEFLMVTVGDIHNYIAFVLLHKLILIPCLLFWLVTLVQASGQRNRYNIGLALAMAAWFLITEMQHRMAGMDDHTIGLVLSVYLLALPFCELTKDQSRQWGIRAMLSVFLAASMVLLVYAALLIVDCVPAFLKDDLFWDGARLNAVTNPNISSRVFMIGIVGCLCFWNKTRKTWQKGLHAVMIAVLFSATALTNSRGTILITCLILAGTVFFSVYDGSWKRFFAGAAVGLLVLAVLFVSSQKLYDGNRDRLVEKVITEQHQEQQSDKEESDASQHTAQSASGSSSDEAEELTDREKNQILGTVNGQGSFSNDMGTFNGRTRIWRYTLEGMMKEPSMFLWGTDDSGQFGWADHTHNAWIETLVHMGIPGLLLSLVFTVQAVWSAICLLWYPQVSLEKKIISMLALGCLVSGVLEPFLFFTQDTWHFLDIMFFLCLGYMVQWRKNIHREKQETQNVSV